MGGRRPEGNTMKHNTMRCTAIIAVVIALCLEACARGAVSRDFANPAVTGIRSGRSTVSVVNRQWVDVRIYVRTVTGMTYRLGIVPVLGSARFALPASVVMPADLTFFAVPLGTDDAVIVGPVAADVGTRLLFTIGTTPSGSTVVKRP